jgi:hypothetical protein
MIITYMTWYCMINGCQNDKLCSFIKCTFRTMLLVTYLKSIIVDTVLMFSILSF